MLRLVTAVNSDIGIKKKINQDSVALCSASTDDGGIVFAGVCDGMGGLQAGEHASAVMVREIQKWFESTLPDLLMQGNLLDYAGFQKSFEQIIRHAHREIQASEKGDSGTTISGVLLAGQQYFTVNVGDSRVYRLSGGILTQLTRDHSYVQREIDAGRMTEAQAKSDPKRNVLLQCIGAGEAVIPDFTKGFLSSGDVFLVCSDGFRHKITAQEIAAAFSFPNIPTEEELHNTLLHLTEINKARKERDNITAIAVYMEEGASNA